MRRLFLLVLATTTVYGQEFTWKEEGKIQRVFLVPGMIADFAAAKKIRHSHGVALRRFSADSFDRGMQKGFGPGQSPVFSDAPHGGNLRALPGGVLVTFSQPTSEADVRDWATANNVVLERAVIKQGPRPMWLVKGPVGLGSLDLARRLSDSPLAYSVSPNWWTELSPK